ncbi:MAG: metal ABC transporter permease [Hydrogenophaga sp.]|jgi:zinc/manganese transport system permease protein|uniref:metal ABC transporter permease n=1 Tax=Hydrogenophaga sp. TaxID=1904254 RepID=UPI002715F19B|nr:metal ABC transporter permease [Hydrogenophaga sp.]MDO9568422.1 metal ABC transporter permease [Hydrogenophaga sp.]MDP1896066.1 metal ABC transporter permease [Hydrogenophaga sp.]MDP3373085.1 metal ABC transporter permease [Hydrogenophaga sp.]
MSSTPWWPALDAWIATSTIFGPFAEFGFMRRALVGCVALSLSAAPVGVFLMLRRMSLTGDAMAHAILPGAAIGYLVAGLSLTAMTIGGIVAGLTVAVGSGLVARNTVLREDASLAAFYLLSLALGVLIVSVRGNSVDLLHVLFGTVLALDDAALALLGGISAVTLVSLALLYRPLVLECLDPGFLRSVSRWSPVAHYGFLGLLVINLVAGFHALGTLMAVGIMVLPAATARFWVRRMGPLLVTATALALLACFAGLLLSYHADWPTSPVIVLCLGVLYLGSLLLAPHGLLRHQRPATTHLRG